MKLEPQDLTKTSCKNCVFASYDGNTQSDCKAGRIDIYREKDIVIEAYDNDKEFFVIKGFCNYYRSKSWNNGKVDLNKAKSEVAPSFDIMIDCENLDSNSQKTILKSLENLNYDPKKVKISLYYPFNQEKKYISNTLEILCIYQPKYWTTVSVHFNKYDFLNDYFMNKLLATYFVPINQKNYCFDLSLLNAIDNSINLDLKKILVAEKDNTLAISSNLFKINKVSKNIIDIDENISDIVSTVKEKGMFISI
jgi:hypothetical protein